jgi:bifunctional ADP-heptose synthase (sugar kinase/adenylyltransferase)
LKNFLALDNCVVVGAADRLEGVREQHREAVEAAGGRVVLAPLVEGKSTTNLIGRIQQIG